MDNTTILIVDDEKSIVAMLETMLRKEGFHQIYTAHTGRDALSIIEKHPIEIIILDVMLPDGSGFDFCPQIRQQTNAYILFLTAKVSDLDVLTGFATGGDDYVTKPFNPLEVAARIKAFIRRKEKNTQQAAPTPNGRYDFGRFILDERAGELIVDGKVITCPSQVYLLLLYFCKHPNLVLSKTTLLEAVWGFDSYVDDNTVSVHIRRIREKIEEEPSNPKLLVTVRGLGYKLVRGNEAWQN